MLKLDVEILKIEWKLEVEYLVQKQEGFWIILNSA